MSITAITIENFKGIKGPVKIDLKPITLLFGPNSAGKSTVLQALQYAYEIFCNRNLNPDRTTLGGDKVNLGGFPAMVRKHDLARTITLRLDIDLSGRELPVFAEKALDIVLEESAEYSDLWNTSQEKIAEAESAWVSVGISWDKTENRPFIKRYEVGINNEILAVITTTTATSLPVFDSFNPLHPLFKSETYEEEKAELVEEADFDASPEEKLAGGVLHPVDFIALGAAFLFPQLRPALRTYAGARLAYEGLKAVSETSPQTPSLTGSEEDSIALPEGVTEEDLIGNADLTLKGAIGEGALPRWDQPLPLSVPTDPSEEQPLSGTHDLLNSLFISSLIVGPGATLSEDLQRMRYIGPIREIPERGFIPQSTRDPNRMASGLSAWDALAYGPEGLLPGVNQWLSKMGVEYSVEKRNAALYEEGRLRADLRALSETPEIMDAPSILFDKTQAILGTNKPEPRLVLRDKVNEIDVHPHDVGIGISQMLPVITEALNAKTGAILEIEQPELHIHPKLQVALGDVFISCANEANNPIFLIETHSEHLMLRFMRRIRETACDELEPESQPLTPEMLAVNYIEATEEGTVVYPIRVDEDGKFIDYWPEGFFEERDEELFA